MTNPTHHPNCRKWYSVIALFAEIPTEQAEKILEKIATEIFDAGYAAGLEESEYTERPDRHLYPAV